MHTGQVDIKIKIYMQCFEINRLFKDNKLDTVKIFNTISNYMSKKYNNLKIIYYSPNCRFNQRVLNTIRKDRNKKLIFDICKNIIIIYSNIVNIVFDCDDMRCDMLIDPNQFQKYIKKTISNYFDVTDHFMTRLHQRKCGPIKDILKKKANKVDIIDNVIWYIMNNSYSIKRKDKKHKGTIYRTDDKMVYVIENGSFITCYQYNSDNKNNFEREERNHGRKGSV